MPDDLTLTTQTPRDVLQNFAQRMVDIPPTQGMLDPTIAALALAARAAEIGYYGTIEELEDMFRTAFWRRAWREHGPLTQEPAEKANA